MYYPDYLEDLAAAITYDRLKAAEQRRLAASTVSTTPVPARRPTASPPPMAGGTGSADDNAVDHGRVGCGLVIDAAPSTL